MLDRTSRVVGGVASKATVRTAGQTVSADQSADQMVSDDEGRWFADICDGLLPKDAGLALAMATGFNERTCYRYAADDRKPPGYFIRALLRSEGGWQWLAALMEGSGADWWTELQRAKRIADAIASVE